jgi:hypothetical protein
MSIIFPNGEKEITVASGSKLAVLSDTAVKIYKKTGYANLPDTWAHFATTTAGTEYLSAAVSAATVFRVEAGAAIANYATGVVPVVVPPLSGGQLFFQQTAASAEADGAQAITASQMINGIVVHTVTTGRTLTTPTGAAITAACPSSLVAGDTFQLRVITVGTGADDISTLTAGDGDVTFVGNVTVGPDASTFNGYGTFLFRYSGSNAWVGYRVG